MRHFSLLSFAVLLFTLVNAQASTGSRIYGEAHREKANAEIFQIPPAYVYDSRQDPYFRAYLDGSISNFVMTYDYGASPGTDIFDINGTYTLGSGGVLGLPQAIVNMSFNGGIFAQNYPANTFVAISGGWRVQSTTAPIRLFRIMNNGIFQIQGRGLNLNGVDATNLQPFSFSVGDNNFTFLPNSIPVAKIAGAGMVGIGEENILSGAPSTDANNQTLSYAWSIISRPQGSSASLTAIDTQLTSLTPDRNGFYVVKLIVNDGIANGIPAIFTFEATGGAEDPLPPAGANNGFINLTSDKSVYLVGESAIINMQVLTNLGNNTDEYFYQPTIAETPFTFVAAGANNFAFTSAPFAAAGIYPVRVNLFIQNKNLAQQLNSTISFLQADNAAINAALQYETNPAQIAALNAKLAANQEEITKAQNALVRGRTAIAREAILNLQVNEL